MSSSFQTSNQAYDLLKIMASLNFIQLEQLITRIVHSALQTNGIVAGPSTGDGTGYYWCWYWLVLVMKLFSTGAGIG